MRFLVQKAISISVICGMLTFASITPVQAVTWKDCGLLLTSLFRGTPESIAWTKRIDQHCSITDQGVWQSCWAHAGAKFYTSLARKLDLIKPLDEVSHNFYFARHIEKQALTHLGRKINPSRAIDETGRLADFDHYVLEYGLVKEADYLPPRFGPKQTTIFEDRDVAKRFYRELNTSSHKSSVINRYLGNLNQVPKTRVAEPLELAVLGKSQFIGTNTYVRALDAPIENLDQVLDVIKKNIDKDYMVYSIWRVNPEVYEKTMGNFGNYLIKRNSRNFVDGLHAMPVIGYRSNAKGKVTELLVQNSWGREFGQNGLMVVDRHFFEKYFLQMESYLGN